MARKRMTTEIAYFILENFDEDNEDLVYMVLDHFGEKFSPNTINNVKYGGYDDRLGINSEDYRTGRRRGRSSHSYSNSGRNYSNTSQSYTPPQSYETYSPHHNIDWNSSRSWDSDDIDDDDDDESDDYSYATQNTSFHSSESFGDGSGGSYGGGSNRSYGGSSKRSYGGGFGGFGDLFDLGDDLAETIGRRAIPFVLAAVAVIILSQIPPMINPFGNGGVLESIGDWFYVRYWTLRIVYHSQMALVSKAFIAMAVLAYLWKRFVDDYISWFFDLPALLCAICALFIGVAIYLLAYESLTYVAISIAMCLVCLYKMRDDF